MKLGMFTLKSDVAWVPPPNRPLFSTRAPRAQEGTARWVEPAATEEARATESKKPSRPPMVIEDEATAS